MLIKTEKFEEIVGEIYGEKVKEMVVANNKAVKEIIKTLTPTPTRAHMLYFPQFREVFKFVETQTMTNLGLFFSQIDRVFSQ